MKTSADTESVVAQRTINTFFLQEDSQKDEGLNGKITRRFKKIQEMVDPKMKSFNFEIEVFFHEQKAMIEEAFEKNLVFNQDIPGILNQFKEYELTPELLEAYQKTEQLNYAFKEKALLIQQVQNPLRETLRRLEEGYIRGLQARDIKAYSPEMIQQVLTTKLNESKAGMMFKIIKNMGLFRLEIDEDEWLAVSFKKGHNNEITYEEVKNVEKIKLRIDRIECVEMMLYGLDFLLKNCFEKAPRLCLSFNQRYISDQEAERFNRCGLWKSRKLDLAIDFRECTFESEDTPLTFFRELEDLEGFRWFFWNTNATQKAVNDFCQLIKSRMKSLKNFVYGGYNCSFNMNPEINSVLINKASEILLLELGLGGIPLTDDDMIFFSEKVLPELKSLQHFELWLGTTQVTDKGFKKLFKSLEKGCASRLKTFLLRINDSPVTDESIGEFALNTLPLMENLEDLNLSFQRSWVTDKSLNDLCRNLKCLASKLKKFGLNVGGTAISDAVIDILALESIPLMKQITSFDMWLNRTKVTEKSLFNLFSSMVVISSVEELELNCTETAVTDENMSIFAHKALPEMNNLKKFTFYASKTKVQDVSLKPFFENLSRCHQLQKMTIWLNDTAIRDESLLSLANTLSSLSHLTTLSLSFYETKLGDLGISHFCKSLKPLAQNLEVLKLDFNDTQVTDEGISVLGNVIAPEMRSLKELKLFVCRTRVGDAGLKPLFENLRETMASIQDITLRLSGTLITDQSLLAFASLPKAESLRTVELWATNTKLSDLSLVPLMHSFKKKVGDVSKLHLMLQNTKITNETLKALSTEALMNMRNLQDFQLNFVQSQVTDASMAMLVDSLANKAQRLRNLVLQFNSAIGDNSIRTFADKVIPNLTNAQDFKLTWTVSLSSSTLKALCVNAKKVIKNTKTFQITSSQISVTSSSSTSYELLKDLSFELNRTRITNFDMQQILETFEGQVSDVKNFSFIVESTSVSNSSIKTLAEKLFPSMLSLESLKMDLENLEFSNETFCLMCRSFENFATKLKSLKTNLRLPTLNDLSINTLADFGLANMTNLESLDMEFFSNLNHHIQPAVIGNLFGKMQNCVKKLKNFSLAMFHLNLSLEAIQTLATQVFPNLESLTDIDLCLHETGIHDSDFALLFSGLRDGVLKNCKFISVAVYEPTLSLSGNALEALATYIVPQLKNVKIFGCFIFGNERYKDESFIKFNKSWQEVASQIERFILKFENTGITDEGVKEFALKTLPEMKSLTLADISFGNTARLGDEGMADLFDGLGGVIGRLSSLKLSLPNTEITDVGIEAIKKREDLDVWKKCSLDISGNKISQENQSFIGKYFK